MLYRLTGLNRFVNPFYTANVLLNALNSASPATPHLLITSILDIFGKLGLPPKDAAELRAKTIQRLLHMPLESLPPLMAFIFNHTSLEESTSLLRKVRQDFGQAFSRERKRRNLHSLRAFNRDQLRRLLLDEEHVDCLVLAVHSIHSSLKDSRVLADIWIDGILLFYFIQKNSLTFKLYFRNTS